MGNSCSFGLRYVSWYKYLIVSLVFSHLGFWSGKLFSDCAFFLPLPTCTFLDVAASLADDYALTHKASFVNKPFKKPFNPQFKPNTPQSKPFNPQQRTNSPQPNPQPQAGLLTADNSSPSLNPKNKDTSENKGQRSSYSLRLFCNYCKGDGHVNSECETLKRRKERQNQNNSRPTGLTSLRSKPQSIFQDENPMFPNIANPVTLVKW